MTLRVDGQDVKSENIQSCTLDMPAANDMHLAERKEAFLGQFGSSSFSVRELFGGSFQIHVLDLRTRLISTGISHTILEVTARLREEGVIIN